MLRPKRYFAYLERFLYNLGHIIFYLSFKRWLCPGTIWNWSFSESNLRYISFEIKEYKIGSYIYYFQASKIRHKVSIDCQFHRNSSCNLIWSFELKLAGFLPLTLYFGALMRHRVLSSHLYRRWYEFIITGDRKSIIMVNRNTFSDSGTVGICSLNVAMCSLK